MLHLIVHIVVVSLISQIFTVEHLLKAAYAELCFVQVYDCRVVAERGVSTVEEYRNIAGHVVFYK